MKYNIQYGKMGKDFEIPDIIKNVTVIEPENNIPPLENPVDEIYNSFQKPLGGKTLKKALKGRKQGDIIVIIDDHTRPVPSYQILNALIKLFAELLILDNEIKILVGTGLHRTPTHKELKRMVGDEIINRFDIIFHDARDKINLEHVGTTSRGNEIDLNSLYVNAGFRISTGYCEPHMFAGFSGGRKSILPGIAGKDAIIFNHSPKNIDSVCARFGIIKENPVHEDSTEAARFLRPEFCINVVINSEHQITKIASGNIFSVFNYLAGAQKKICFKPIDHKYDIVITGNGGYPLDLSLYQSVKSMTIAELAVKEGGAIINCNECSDGVGNKDFIDIINSGKTPEQIYEEVMNGKLHTPDIWEAQILARILIKYKVYFVSMLPIEKLGNIGLIFAENIENAINSAIKDMGKSAEDVSILILPKGPQILPGI